MSLKDIFGKEEAESKPVETTNNHNKPERVSKPGERYSENELMVRLKFIIGCCLAFTLIGIVFTVLYSIMFVTQPLNAISPIDQKFFELIIPVATFLCGTLSGIMLAGTGKEAAMAGAKAAGMNGMNMNGNGMGQHNMPSRPMQSYSPGFNQPVGGGFQRQSMQQPMPSMMSNMDDLDLIPGQSPKMHD